VVDNMHENVRVDVVGNLAFVEICGFLDRERLMRARDVAIGHLEQAGAVGGWFVDFTEANVKLTVADLAALFDAGPADAQVAMPAAMLVHRRDLALFQGHVWDVAWRGVVRRAFVCQVQALAWLKEREESAVEAVRAHHQPCR
jgi:hypothetical protein